MPVNTKIYDQKFFDNTFKFEAESAQAFVAILIRHFAPKSVIDIGCGAGRDAAVFVERGYDYIGVDLSEGMLKVAAERAPTGTFRQMDFLNWISLMTLLTVSGLPPVFCMCQRKILIRFYRRQSV